MNMLGKIFVYTVNPVIQAAAVGYIGCVWLNTPNVEKPSSELREQNIKENPIIIQDLNDDGRADIAATTEYGATKVYLQLEKKDTYQRLSDYVRNLPIEERENLKNTIETKLEKVRGHKVKVF